MHIPLNVIMNIIAKFKLNFKIIKFLKIYIFLFYFIISSCLEGGSEFSSLDKKQGSGEGIGRCSIKQTIPNHQNIIKASGISGNITNFSVVTEGTDCSIKFFLNGSLNPLSSSGNNLSLDSSLLNNGNNQLRVEIQGPIGSDFKIWNIIKNTPPTCTLNNPTSSNLNITQGSSPVNFQIIGNGEVGEIISYSWLLNNQISPLLTKVNEVGNISQYSFNHSSLAHGNYEIKVQVSDGTDTASCIYNVNIGPDCSITGKTPNVSSATWAANTTAPQTMSVNTSNSSCLVTWTINGNPVVGSGSSRNFYSSEITTGSNIIKAEVISNTNTSYAQWVITKNSPPFCVQSPSPFPTPNISVGSSLNLSSTIHDDNGHSLTWQWFEGTTPITSGVSNSGNFTSWSFNPNSQGLKQIKITVNDGYDNTECLWNINVTPACSILSSLPSDTSLFVSSFPSSQHIFSVTPSNATDCSINWELDGVNYGSGSTKIFSASIFAPGADRTLKAIVSNAGSSDTKTWLVRRNNLPVCSSQTPVTSGHIIGVGSPQNFSLDITDTDSGQTYIYDWKLNGASAPFTPSSSGTHTSGTWTPTSGNIGVNNMSIEVKNYYYESLYDSAICSWTTTVLPPCSVSEKSPNLSSLKIPFNPTHQQSFSVVANHPSCSINWKIENTSVGSGSFYNLSSNSLAIGNNNFKAVLTNPINSVEAIWTVTRNQVHNCGTQNPSGTVSINLGSSQNFEGTMNNPDGDPLTFSWSLSGSNINGVSSNILNFTPTSSQLGANQLLRLKANDGYDDAYCDWTVNISDPNIAQILSWSPTTNPVVILSTGSQTFSVTAIGTGITYKWYLDNVLLPSRTNSSETFTYLDISPGAIRALKVIVTDAYNNTAEKTFFVKRNQKPVINSVTPSMTGLNKYRINIGSSVTTTVTASDPDNDSLNYEWTLNNAPPSSHPTEIFSTNSNQATFSPSNNSSYLGLQQLRVIVSDGHENATYLWTISTNYFSTQCNQLYNGSISSEGGKICTLVGNPSIGHGEDVMSDLTRLKISPNHVIELEPDVYAYADGYYHVIGVVNDSSSPKTYFNQTISPGKMQVVLGVGQRGRNKDASSYVTFIDTSAEGTSYPNFKIHDPIHLAYDPSHGGILYIADRGNHRVLALINSGSQAGNIIRVLGLPNGTTSNTHNEGNGIDVSCSFPAGVAINQEGVNKFLYVTCGGHHNIKKVNITNFTGSNIPTFSTTIAVGRLTTSNQPTEVDSLLDGTGGSSHHPTTGAVARTNWPFGIFTYNGLVIFSDYTRRIRAYNPTGSLVNFYPDFESQIDKFVSANLQFNAPFLSSPPGGTSFNPTNVLGLNTNLIPSGSINNYIIEGPSGGRMNNGCHLLVVRPRNASNNIIAAPSNLSPLVIASASVLYSDPNCSGSASTTLTLNIPAGRTLAPFWIKTTANTTINVGANSFNFNSLLGTSGTSTDTSGIFYSYVTSAASSFHPLDCLPLEVRISKTNGSPLSATINMTSDFHLALSHNNIGTFYADANCSSTITNRVSFLNGIGPAIRTLFYRRHVLIPPNHVTSIFGSQAPLNTPTNYSTGVGTAVYSGVGYWLAPLIESGNLTGIAYNVLFNNTAQGTLNHSVSFLNLTSNSVNRGVTIPPYSSASIANSIGGTAGYLNDNVTAATTRFNLVKGISITSGSSPYVLISDFGNRRVRKVELWGTNGQVRVALGLGRTRDRMNALNTQATQANLAFPYKLEFLNNRIYFSEQWNHRIRYVDLNTGIVDTIAGAGWGTTFSDGNDATAEFMTSPRGFKIISWPNHLMPTHYVLVYVQPYQIRAVNLSATPISNFFGVSLLPGKVRTIAGDNTITTSSTGWGPNTEGMNAIGARIREAFDVAFIKGDIYFVDYLDQCLLRVTQDGKLYQVNPGVCNTNPSTTDGEFGDFVGGKPPAAFKLNRPIMFGNDASYPENYFILGNYLTNPSHLVYINSMSTNISFFGFSAPQIGYGTSNIARASKLYNIPSSLGQARAQGIASWSASVGAVGPTDRICWSTGEYDQHGGSWPGGTNGEHAIYCALRSVSGSPILTVGLGQGPGGPLGFEQEGIKGNIATFYGPTGLVFDDEGNLYIADSGNHIIRMVRRWWP